MKENTMLLLKKFRAGMSSAGSFIKKNFIPGESALQGAAIGIGVVLILTVVILTFKNIHSQDFIAIFIMMMVLLSASFLMGYLGVHLIRLLGRIHFWLFVAIMAFVPLIMMFYNIKMPLTLLILLVIILFPALAGGSIRALSQNRKGGGVSVFAAWLALITGIAGMVTFYAWLAWSGSPLVPQENAYDANEQLPSQITLENPGLPGEHNVLYLTYGSGKDRLRKEYGSEAVLITDGVDASAFLQSWTGFSGKMRTREFGFDKNSLPLNARVWYPEGDGLFPLVLIVHGNHSALDFSDPGYEYLGKHLASKGYILASVDENFLNGTYTDLFSGLKGENSARGWLLLKHLQVWRHWLQDPDNLFYQKVDMDKIALIGHSRGGEAVGHAALFNRLPFYPDDANEAFDFDFNIRSIIAIAPSDGQYQPASVRTPLSDINYFTIQGSHDFDVSSFQGLRQYSRVMFSENFDGFKAGLYIYAANHGQFNSVWGNKDLGFPMINFFNLKQLMPEEDQQQIARVYITGFLEATLQAKTAYRHMFIDNRTARHWLPRTIYLSQYQQAQTQWVATFEEDLNVATASLPGSNVTSDNLSTWREKSLPLNWGNYDSRGVILGWNTTDNDTLVPSYRITWPEDVMQVRGNSLLVFSMAETGDKASAPKRKNANASGKNHQQNSGKNNESAASANQGDDKAAEKHSEKADHKTEFIDFTIRLTDAAGTTVEFPLSQCSPLQKMLKRRLTKWSKLQNAAETESVMQFFWFPLDEIAAEPFNADRITSIEFIFNKTQTGVVAIDDIGFMNR
jgi:dienelactone hydrolase